jgi:hypothetical protein
MDMSNETLYYKALEKLSYNTLGSSDFEKISRILIKFIFKEYDFKPSEGGRGTQDGGYDGYDQNKRAKLACSLEKDYRGKIKNEIEKSKENGDLELFYLSNQKISEIEKNQMKADPTNKDIKLFIFGIDKLSREIENLFQNQNNPELYDLLGLSFLKVGELYRRCDAKIIDVEYNGKTYKKRTIINNKANTEIKISENPLLDFILSCCSEGSIHSFKHIVLCGIGYLGKSFLMKKTFNTLIDEFSDTKNRFKYKFLPFILFYELKYYTQGSIISVIKNSIDPLFVFLDGLDELSEDAKIFLNNEIQNILRDNKYVRFIISGRNSSFIDLDIFSISNQLYLEKYLDPYDTELYNLMLEYKDTPIADLLPIPTYRNFILSKKISKNSKLEEFYTLLVKENLMKDKKKSDYSNKKTSRKTSFDVIDVIIEKLSEFCYELFIEKRNVFTECELKEKFSNDEYFILFMNSSIVDYKDENEISFISNFYFEYFVCNVLLTKNIKTIIQIFFTREKIKIPLIDILILFINCAKTKSKKMYESVMKKMLNNNIVCILLSEFDSIADNERYNYFISIFEKYKKDNRHIYYHRSGQMYGPLKNIDNMALRMQQLLLDNHKTKAATFLSSEITNFLKTPKKENILSFSNAVILLNPFIKNLWLEKEQTILKKISLSLIKFFIYNDLSTELKGLLSEEFIFDWYNKYNWTAGWEQKEWKLFYKNISGNAYKPLSEITSDREFVIKFNIFLNFHSDSSVKPLLFPVLRYIMKNKCNDNRDMASTVPEIITDDYDISVMQIDYRIYTLLKILKEIKLNVSEVLDLLLFAIKNNLYKQVKNMYSNLIEVLEEKLYNNISLLEDKDYINFFEYYLNINEYEFDDRLFKVNQTKEIESLKEFFVNELLNKNTEKLGTWRFLCKLINFTNIKHSLKYLREIKKKSSKSIYEYVVRCIFNTEYHILNKHKFINSEYNILFKKEIIKKTERKKYLKIEKKI